MMPPGVLVALVLLGAHTTLPDVGAVACEFGVARPWLSAKSFSSRGVIKSFGPERAFVNIAHEDIPGYMGAMTMAFEPRSKDQVAPLAIGDSVVFTFTESEDGRRLIDSIRKR